MEPSLHLKRVSSSSPSTTDLDCLVSDGDIVGAYPDFSIKKTHHPLTLTHTHTHTGFLPTTIEGSRRGNYALMDVIAALHWVHDNIVEMGGDAGNITIVGHGGGGAALVNLLMLSPMARGESRLLCACVCEHVQCGQRIAAG